MPRRSFTVDGLVFVRKKDLLDYVRREIHSRYEQHQDLSEDHLRFMTDLLRYHPWSDQKIGVGIRRMWLQTNGNFPTKGFWLERVNGTKTDFSFYQCLEDASRLREFKAACRAAVAPFVIDFRQKHFQSPGEQSICPISGEEIRLHSSHVDHESPNTFDQIVRDFLEQHKVDVEKAPLSDHRDGIVGSSFTDPVFAETWIRFHNSRAKLRVISVQANLTMKRKPAGETT